MSNVCALCGKKLQSGHRVSHAHNLTKRKWKPNLHSVRVEIDGVRKRAKLCTKCLRSTKIKKVVG
jgi:large subunit ribosomal protein L28